MELLLVIVSLFTLFFLLKVTKVGGQKNKENLPPGPLKLPIIGNLHQLAFGLPHQRFCQLAKKYGPLMHVQLGQVSTVVVSSPETAKEILRTHDSVFANRPSLLLGEVIAYGSTNIAFSPSGEYWRKLRNICMLELLSLKRVQSLRHVREEVVRSIRNTIAENTASTINITEIIFRMSYTITSRALGFNAKDQAAFAKIIEDATRVVSESGATDMFPSVKLIEFITGTRRKMEQMFKKSDKMFDRILDDRRTKRKMRREDEEEEHLLIDVLLKFENDTNSEFSLTTNNIKAVLQDIWIGGIETSAGTTEWAMSELLRHPDMMKKAQAEVRQVYQGTNGTIDESNLHKLEYLKLVIKEVLRLHPSAPLLLPREPSEQRRIHGYDIPAKTQVIVNAWALGRDPKVWVDPERFNPDRFINSSIDYKGGSYEFIPFGAGRRICPGLTYGLAVVEIQLAMLLYHFDWKLPNGMLPEDVDMTESFGLSMKRKNTLHVIPISYP